MSSSDIGSGNMRRSDNEPSYNEHFSHWSGNMSNLDIHPSNTRSSDISTVLSQDFESIDILMLLYQHI